MSVLDPGKHPRARGLGETLLCLILVLICALIVNPTHAKALASSFQKWAQASHFLYTPSCQPHCPLSLERASAGLRVKYRTSGRRDKRGPFLELAHPGELAERGGAFSVPRLSGGGGSLSNSRLVAHSPFSPPSLPAATAAVRN